MSSKPAGSAGAHPQARRLGLQRQRDPGASPPPPQQTSTSAAATPASAACAAISSPTVPCPAITSGWSKGGISVSPRAAASPRPERVAVRGRPVVEHHLGARARACPRSSPPARPTGIRITAGAPCAAAAQATPCAWLPEEIGQHAARPRRPAPAPRPPPRPPRALNEPVTCRHSALTSTRRPAIRSSAAAASSGVRRMPARPRRRRPDRRDVGHASHPREQRLERRQRLGLVEERRVPAVRAPRPRSDPAAAPASCATVSAVRQIRVRPAHHRHRHPRQRVEERPHVRRPAGRRPPPPRRAAADRSSAPARPAPSSNHRRASASHRSGVSPGTASPCAPGARRRRLEASAPAARSRARS